MTAQKLNTYSIAKQLDIARPFLNFPLSSSPLYQLCRSDQPLLYCHTPVVRIKPTSNTTKTRPTTRPAKISVANCRSPDTSRGIAFQSIRAATTEKGKVFCHSGVGESMSDRSCPSAIDELYPLEVCSTHC